MILTPIVYSFPAANFAYYAHRDQSRKYNAEPYFYHVSRVAAMVASQGPEYANDESLMSAAYLHDVLEDTDVTFNDLVQEFGCEVALLVSECTNVYTAEAFPKFNRKYRKHLEAIRLSCISERAQLIKRCDMADNIPDFIRNDPKFAIQYMKEKIEVLEEMLK